MRLYRSQNIVLYVLAGALVLVLVFGALSYFALRHNRRINRQLAVQNTKILEQSKELIEMTAKAKEATEAKFNFFTNISFHHQFSFAHSTPATNSYGLLVIVVPVIGGIIVGLMAMYGSKAIRGHGIPEAMEQILTNKSKIRPSITFFFSSRMDETCSISFLFNH